MLYGLGALIVFVAIAAFSIGLLMGRYSRGELASVADAPVRITGRLTYMTTTGEVAGDSEAVVIVVPVGRQPDEKLEIAPLRPDAPPPDPQHPTLVEIRSVGGDFARAEPNGEFSVAVPRAGEYFVLLLSSHARRQDEQTPTTMEIAQIARYFKPADALLGANSYRWSKETVLADTQINHLFIGS